MATKQQALKIILSWSMILFWAVITATVFVAHATSGFLEALVVAGNSFGYVWLFLWYLVWIGVVGSILAYLLMLGGKKK